MEKLREHIKKEITRLMEEKYPAPAEIISALKDDLKLNPLIRYVSTLKAANTVPPSYEVRLVNGASFMIYLEEFSLMVKIGAKRYYLGDMDERSQAIDDINRLLTDPQFNANAGEEGGEDSGEGETFNEPADEPAEEPDTTG